MKTTPHDAYPYHPAVARYYDGMTRYYLLFYSRVGLHYGLWNRHTLTLRQALLNHKREMLARLGPLTPDSHILDAGCGAGWTSVFLGEQTGCHVTGITLSAKQVCVARRHARRRNVDGRVTFLQGDFCATGLSDASFSHAIASESSCHAEDKRAWLAEMHRLLKPGGRLVIADYYLTRREAEMNDVQRREYALFRHGFTVPDLPYLPDMENWITASGFRLRESEDITHDVLPTAYYIRLLGLVALPFTWLLRALRLVPRELLPHLVTCIHQPIAIRRLGCYRLLVMEKPRV